MTATRTALGGAASFFLAFFLSSVVPTPLLWYLPLAERFVFATVVTEVGIDYFGRVLLAAVAGAVGALLARLWARASVPMLAACVLSACLLCVALEVTVLSGRHPVPLSLPARETP